MDWPTMAGCLFAAGICAFIIGGYRVSLRSGMLGRSMLQNVGLSKQERAVLRDRFRPRCLVRRVDLTVG